MTRIHKTEVITIDMQKVDCIPTRFEICGGEDCSGAALSRLWLIFGYGSMNDGERVELTICGDCADSIHDLIRNKSTVL